ncbi:dTDP-4-dehydrorhamnose 3,5-epimerase family protein [Tuberibacillus sp. Marseille-P3662]|uniref:dTDP-4-dehydrorhamnose 3,5-epimerase family protein n=1 Tax=Tuberibacillus sp. Marseille-P3662 TaxID=1965358 RepID=UPI000A1CD780|nr:dTDP-4-dehydrorhamnose 3,5-epimerase family protein [Tuberibacillus sp. Marseille-P3662]
MIDGVKTKTITKNFDDRGYLAELVRSDEALLTQFGQATLSMSFPGVIKAFHYHRQQEDLWFFPSGHAQVVLHDLRQDSQTKGVTEVYYMGEEHPILLLIPRLVAHGYRVLGNKPATILYFTSEPYNRDHPDEERIAWDDPVINFDWETKAR